MNFKTIKTYIVRIARLVGLQREKKGQPRKVFFPTYIFRDRSVAVLEAMVAYLLEKGMTYREIGELLNRDERTIWTTGKRVRDKRHGRR